MTLSDLSIRKPVFAWMLMIGLIAFGAICFFGMGISQLPDVPTLDESGLPGYEANVWFGIIAPRKTPDAVVEKLSKEIVAIVHSKKIRQKLIGLGLNPIGSTPQAFQALMDREKTKWSAVIKENHIHLQ